MRHDGIEKEPKRTHEQIHWSLLPKEHSWVIQCWGRCRRRGFFTLPSHLRGGLRNTDLNRKRCTERVRRWRETAAQVHRTQIGFYRDMAGLAQKWRRRKIRSIQQKVPGVWLQAGNGRSWPRVRQSQKQHQTQICDWRSRLTLFRN